MKAQNSQNVIWENKLKKGYEILNTLSTFAVLILNLLFIGYTKNG